MNPILKSSVLKTSGFLAALLLQCLLARGQIKGGTVVAWGDNSFGQTDVPAGLTNVVQIAARGGQCLALKADGTIVAWGDGSDGVSNVPPLTNVVWIATGQNFDIALGSDGTYTAWGDNAMGQCTTNNITNATAVAAGFDTSLVLKSDGTYYGFGDNETGPLDPQPELTNLVALAGGYFVTYSLTAHGDIAYWGFYKGLQYMWARDYGNMLAISANLGEVFAVTGVGTIVNGPGGLTNIVAIAAGDPYCLALQNDGTVVEWGNTLLPAGLSNVVAVAAGDSGGLAIVSDGSPQFVRQYSTQTPYAGTTFSLNASAVGVVPLSYQWYFNGASLVGQTNATLTITNIQPSTNGSYSVSVSNALGAATSSNMPVVVSTCPPIITSQTADSLVLLGSNMTISVSATGPVPITYQWLFNGTDILDATNAALTLTNFQDANEGDYTVIVSNTYSGTNADISLLAGDLGGALNAPNLTWNQGWSWETNFTHDGIAAARSGAIGANNKSSLDTTVNGPGTLTFWWWIDSDQLDTLTFSINGVSQESISWSIGLNWSQFPTIYLPGGTQNLDWTYKRNSSFNVGQTAAFVDQVSYIPGATLILTTSPTNQSVPATGGVTFNVSAIGTPPISYQWQFNGTNIPNATNTSLSLTGLQAPNAGSYTAVVSDPFLTNTATTVLTVIPVPPSVTSQPVNQRTPVNGVAGFSVGATGSTPFGYQWQFNGTNIDSATNSSLSITNVQATNAGAYQVTVSNGAGTTNSHTAVLTVAQLIAWGITPVPTIPLTLTNAAAIAAGQQHGLALNFDSTVTAWGDNSYRQTNIPAGLSNVIAISVGYYHSLALKNDGTVVAWGAGTNNSGPLNFGQSIVPPGLTNVAAVSAGGYHSLILRSNGSVLAWGYNSFGQTNVPAGLSNIVAIAAGGDHNLALRNDGTVFAWGAGTNNLNSAPNYGQSKVPAGLGNVVAIAAGTYHSLALKSDGAIVAWGYNGYGQTNVPAGLSNVVAIACGGYHNLAITSGGTFTVWGNNQYGQTNIPVGVTNVVAIAGGVFCSMCIMNDGTPVIVRESPPQTVYAGSSDNLSVTPLGTGPLSFQWLFDGTNIDGATNSILNLVQLPLTSSGSYQCVVSNASGSVTSAPVSLSVLRTIPQFLVSSNSLQLTTTGLNLTLGNLSGHGPSIIYASTDLVDWQPILTNPVTVGTVQIFDPSATNLPSQFYRAAEQ